MPVFVVTYDLNSESRRPPLLQDLKEAYPWARLSESCYAVEAASADVIYDRLRKHTDDNDYLWVVALKRPYRGWGPQEVHTWLEDRLTY